MKWTNVVLATALAAVSAVGLISPARAAVDRYDGYRFDYYRGADSPERHRRRVLRDRMYDIADRVRLANREGDLSRHDADRIYDRLDTVRDFIRGDHYITETEFHRRMDDMDEAQDILRHAVRHHRH